MTVAEQPQHMQALNQANETRLARAALKQEIKRGRVRVPDLLTAEIPDWLERMAVADLLRAVPYLPKLTYQRFLIDCPVGELQPVGRVTIRQRHFLAEALLSWEARRAERLERLARSKVGVGSA